MALLVKPNPNQHEYVVGIDFGHGETSAAICRLQWNTSAGKSDIDASDIRINPTNTGNEKVLVSAISIIAGNMPRIGTEAFASDQLNDGATIRVCFKQPPTDINGEPESLMIQYMSAVYKRVRDMQKELTDTNHIVYIARPSGWQDEDVKELYREMAISAGIPLAGLTSESRAAIFYAKNNPKIGFAKIVDKGAIVFDLGSSTLDFTYLAKDDEVVDFGYPLGASIVERAIFEDKMELNEGVQLLLKNHPQYKDALLFKAREIKEDIYKKDEDTSSIDMSFMLRNVVSRECSDYASLKNEFIEVEYESIASLNESIEAKEHYISNLKEALNDYISNYIPGKQINGVFLTGGASRMNFIADTIRETYKLTKDQVRLDPDNPSLTISRGIAMLGRADAVSDVLLEKLLNKLKTIDVSGAYKGFVDELSKKIGNETWTIVEKELKNFKNSNSDKSVNDLEASIRSAMKNYATRSLNPIFLSAVQNAIMSKSEEIRGDLNKIISFYTPGAELKPVNVSNLSLDTTDVERQLKSTIDGVIDSIAEQVTNNVGEIIADFLWAALGIFLWGLFYIGYKGLQYAWNHLTKSDAERAAEEREKKEKQKKEAMAKKLDSNLRKKCYAKIMESASSIKRKLISGIQSSLSNNSGLRNKIEPEIRKFSREYVESNISTIRIPIE